MGAGITSGPDEVVESVRSLGFRTHLAILRLGGSTVTDRGDCLVVATPGSPTFWWGNFLLLRQGVGRGEAEQWLSRFEAELPWAAHRAFGLDDPAAPPEAVAHLGARGFSVDRSVVMTTSAPAGRRGTAAAAVYRRLAGDDDWAQHVALNQQIYPGSGSASELAFVRDRAASHRRAVEAGEGVWLGAFLDGRLVSQLGVLRAGAGLGRYQDVETHPDFRRRGLAGALVVMGGTAMRDDFGTRTLVMVADPDDEAFGLYRSLGFVESEHLLEASLSPAAAAETTGR